jgi:hypothetical protein
MTNVSLTVARCRIVRSLGAMVKCCELLRTVIGPAVIFPASQPPAMSPVNAH